MSAIKCTNVFFKWSLKFIIIQSYELSQEFFILNVDAVDWIRKEALVLFDHQIAQEIIPMTEACKSKKNVKTEKR